MCLTPETLKNSRSKKYSTGWNYCKDFSMKVLSIPVLVHVFEKLYFITIVPVTDYASEVSVYKNLDLTDKLQY